MSKRNEKETVGSVVAMFILSFFLWSAIGTAILWFATNPKIWYAGQSNYQDAVAADATLIGK